MLNHKKSLRQFKQIQISKIRGAQPIKYYKKTTNNRKKLKLQFYQSTNQNKSVF